MSQLEIPVGEVALDDVIELEPINKTSQIIKSLSVEPDLEIEPTPDPEPAISLGTHDGTAGLMLPDRQTFFKIARRVVRTTSPLLAADVTGLVLSGILAGYLVAWALCWARWVSSRSCRTSR